MFQKFENYQTNYAKEEGVDFIGYRGPFRAIEMGEDFDSYQELIVPPKDAEIWQEWHQQIVRRIGATALSDTSTR